MCGVVYRALAPSFFPGIVRRPGERQRSRKDCRRICRSSTFFENILAGGDQLSAKTRCRRWAGRCVPLKFTLVCVCHRRRPVDVKRVDVQAKVRQQRAIGSNAPPATRRQTGIGTIELGGVRRVCVSDDLPPASGNTIQLRLPRYPIPNGRQGQHCVELRLMRPGPRR